MPDTKVLIVDDETTVCKTFSKFLATEGFATATAPNALQAIRTCRNSQVDVVISDIHMPEMDGTELLRELRTEQPNLPVILMSGATDLRTALHLLKDDAFDFLAKPVEPGDLLSTLRRAVESNETPEAPAPEARNLGSIKHQLSEDRDDCSIVTCYQPLDQNAEATLVQPLRRLLREGILRKICILRMNNTNYINNIGLNQLLEIERMLRAENHDFIVVEMQEPVRRYLSLLGYLDFFATAGSAQEALVGLRRPQSALDVRDRGPRS